VTELRNTEHDLARFRIRVLAAALFVLFAFGLLVARLVYLQIGKHEELSTQAENNRIAVVPIPPNRGLILDRNGVVLANNYSAYTLEIAPAKVADLDDPRFDFENVIPQSLAFLRSAGIEKEIPLIAAGGIRCHADIARVQALGAAAVQIGTPFAVTLESDAHAEFKRVLAGAKPEDIVEFMSVAGLPARAVRTPWLETYLKYLPKLQAVKNIVARPADFGLSLPELHNHPYFLSVPIEHDMDVAVAIRLAGMSLEDFQTLNPQMNRPVILAAGTPQVLLPYDNANRFVRELPQHRGPLATWTAWTAPKTMRPAEAAKTAGMSEAQMREVNRIPAHMLIKTGSTLLVPRGNALLADVSSHVADNAMLSLAPDGPTLRRVSLRAGRKDSVASVARRYRVSPAQVAQWNEVGATATFAPGQSIVVYVAQATRKAPTQSQHTARGAHPSHQVAGAHTATPNTAHAGSSTAHTTKHLRLAKN